MKIPLQDGSEFDLSPFLDGYRAKYPQVQDMAGELAKMHLWLAQHPSKRFKMPLKFVDNWLKKARPAKQALRVVGSAKMGEAELLALGRSMNESPRIGESWAQFGRRLADISDRKAREA